MPFMTIYIREGCSSEAIEKSLKEITVAGAEILENTLPRMIRIRVYDAPKDRVYSGGANVAELNPTVVFNIGPGRSGDAKLKFMDATAEILHKNLGCPKESVRAFVYDNANPNNFCIGGKPKDFTKKVN